MQTSASLSDLQETFIDFAKNGEIIDAYEHPYEKKPHTDEVVIVLSKGFRHTGINISSLAADLANKLNSVHPLNPECEKNYVVNTIACSGNTAIRFWPNHGGVKPFLDSLNSKSNDAAIDKPYLKVARATSRIDGNKFPGLNKVFMDQKKASTVINSLIQLVQSAYERPTAAQRIIIVKSFNTLKEHLPEMRSYRGGASDENKKLIDNIEGLIITTGVYYALGKKHSQGSDVTFSVSDDFGRYNSE